jgi:hypothetical protein
MSRIDTDDGPMARADFPKQFESTFWMIQNGGYDHQAFIRVIFSLM